MRQRLHVLLNNHGISPEIHLENGGDPGSNPGASVELLGILQFQKTQRLIRLLSYHFDERIR